MKAIKVHLGKSSFLLPESHWDNYQFPDYLIKHKEAVKKCVEAYEAWQINMLGDMPPMPDMREFKEKTGIIGVPFDLRCIVLYEIDRNIEVDLEVNL